ncbi:transcriptional regulator, AraC family [Bacteroides faecichinchillae]|uniref:Transcriptional regulator, AraC family n=2 Tax=Bacteroides faecichinchillae TaxID=871325 RepID=A0A1M5E313_9BACE|nr:transcriptional regulator, AraC family [Bacteroides faecichinchillae]
MLFGVTNSVRFNLLFYNTDYRITYKQFPKNKYECWQRYKKLFFPFASIFCYFLYGEKQKKIELKRDILATLEKFFPFFTCIFASGNNNKTMQPKKTTKEEYQKCVNVVVEYINQHLGEEIDLKSLAKISNFSPFYFHRIMKAFLGEPIGTFIVRTRTETAARLLRYSDIPIADIAYRIGYSSPSSLSKVFKQFYGISPLEYRNNKNFVIMKPAIIRPDLELKKEIRNIPERNVIYIRLSGDYKLNDYGGTWGRLCQFIFEQKLPMGEAAPLCIYHDDPKVTPVDKLRTDVCMVIPENVAPKGDIGFKQIPAGRYATFIYKGSYEHLQAVYDTIYGKYLPEMECTIRDEASAERYLNNPCCTAPEDLLTEIYIPVE